MNIHFTADDWERIERDWSAWWAGELERPLVMIENEVLPDYMGHDDFHVFTGFVPSDFPNDMPADQVVMLITFWLESRRFYGDAFPKWWNNFGPGIMAGFIGGQVHADKNTVWFTPSEPGQAIQDLEVAYDPDNFWWQRVQDITRTAVEKWGDQAVVGFTDLGGNLDILASLRDTQQLLYDVMDAPDEVARLCQQITRLWLRYYDEQYDLIKQAGRGSSPWAAIWSPGRCYMFQSDFAYMISPQMFERYVMPDLAECCAAMDHGFYHLDGKGQIPHLDMLLSLKDLKGIQWIPGDGAPPSHEWLPLLKRIRDGGKLCQLYVTAEGARAIVRELGGRGFALAISDEMSATEADDFLKLLTVEDKDN